MQRATEWLERRLPWERGARWRARMLLGILSLVLFTNVALVVVMIATETGHSALWTSGITILLLGVLLLAGVWFRAWSLAAWGATVLFTISTSNIQLFDPGPQGSAVGVAGMVVFIAGMLCGRHAALAVALPLAAVIFVDGRAPHLSGLSPGNATTDLVLSSCVPLIIAGMTWIVDRALTISMAEQDQAREEAEAGARAKEAFLATMSHEIRTPLNGVLGIAQILSQSELSSDQAHLVRTLQQSGDALRGVLNDVLDYSQLEAGQLQLSPQPIELSALLEEVRCIFAASAAQKGLTLDTARAAGLPAVVRGDGFRIRQILLNLVSNAIKFTAEGHIAITAEAAGEGEVCFRVRDTGIGISPERQDELFSPFVQASGDTARQYGGTGLGLAISARLARVLGGALSVSSAPGRGSVFSLTLPLEAIDAAPTMRAAVASGPAGMLSGRVLLVEDNAINQLVAVRLLSSWGLHVVVADDGQEALARVEEAEHDLILMDQFMPNLDGLGAARALRARGGWTSKVPILALTASAASVDRARCLAAGMDGVIAKPIDAVQLHAALARYLPAVSAATA